MSSGAQGAAAFYGTARGAVAGGLLRARLKTLWPDLQRQSVLGFGYALPYLRLWRDQASRCLAVTPPPHRPSRWPPGRPNLLCSAEEDALPFPDMAFDRILLVHGLETAENARRLLREVWRVLRDDGRVLIVAPNRRSLWAQIENTPFGHGQPYSVGQIDRLLAATLFRVERRDGSLYLPPADWRVVLRSAALIERAGRRVAPGLAGVIITEAVKDLYAALPIEAVSRRRLALAEAGG